jgi:protein-S-isoprenylcysteine O-methyltransferase Ste14
MRTLETTIPPPVVMILAGALAWALSRSMPALAYTLPWRAVVVNLLAVAGIAFNLAPKVLFTRAGTTVNPLAPDQSSALVTSGPYRFTRNPMYVGQALLLLGWTLYLQHAFALLAVPAFLLYITRFQVIPEERVLSQRFPAEYAAFRARTRRWL